jgi:RecA-family ATPase
MEFYTPKQLRDWKAPERKMLIANNILCPQYKMIMYGKGGLYKSLLCLHTAIALARGENWLGYKTCKCKAVFMTAEGCLEDLQDRELDYFNGMQVDWEAVDPSIRLTVERDTKLDRGYGIDMLESKLFSKFVPDVMIIDPIYAVTSGRMTDEYDVRKFIDEMNKLITKYKFALILVHHTRKDQMVDGEVVECDEDDLMGSVVWRNWCDTIIKVSKTDRTDRDGVIRVSFSKCRNTKKKILPFEVQILSEPLRVIRPDLEFVGVQNLPLFRPEDKQTKQ